MIGWRKKSNLSVRGAIAALLVCASVASASLSVRGQSAVAIPADMKVIAVGHRGVKAFAPENTLAAQNIAIAMGARSIEMDVRMTKDGEFVVMHDPLVNRTTNGSGFVSQLTLAEIKALDAGSWFSPDFAGERVPTLREALRNIKGRAAPDIDFKAGPMNSAELIAKLLDEEGFDDGSLVTVFVRTWDYEKIRRLPARYRLRANFRVAEKTRDRAENDGAPIFGVRQESVRPNVARLIAAEGYTLFSNAMGEGDNDRGYNASLQAGARFIQTDRLDRLAPYLKSRGVLLDCLPARDLTCFEAGTLTKSEIADAGYRRPTAR
jgi:glycerophosphoryl diester phosphodiesterase